MGRIAARSGPIAANRLRAALSALWTWGLRTGLVEADINPVSFTVRQPENSRDRTLSGSELRAVWRVTGDGKDYSRIVRLCLLTGCRREEIGGLRWDEIQTNRIAFSPGRMKGNLAHEISLLPMISSALPERPDHASGSVFGRRGTGFSGWSKSKIDLDRTAIRAREIRKRFPDRLRPCSVIAPFPRLACAIRWQLEAEAGSAESGVVFDSNLSAMCFNNRT